MGQQGRNLAGTSQKGLLLLTPLRQEWEALRDALQAQGYTGQREQIGRLPSLVYEGGRFWLARGGHGKVQFALHTQYLLDRLPAVGLVICAGAAGSLVDTLQAGDVVVATVTIEHDYTLRFARRPLPRFPGYEPVLQALAQEKAEGSFRLHLGPIASGDEDIIDPGRAHQLHQETGALAVAWEGAGGARACAFNHLPFLEIRGITDAADQAAPRSFAETLTLAMTNVATIIVSLLLCSRKTWPLETGQSEETDP
ncbi:MAG: acyltransferase [Nitrospinota bacterium]|nr:MAG: acyltransferase [Nitrospinota bacterium]